jgi:predicted nucleotide-binding protein (sugar kinase/HSP70/actin superfamily)
VLGYAGMDDAMIVSPNQDTSFYKEFACSTDKSSWGFMLDAWIAMVGIDLMGKLLLKIRPYAKNRQAAQQIYDECLKIWLNAAENEMPFGQRKKLFADFAKKFSSLEFDYANRKPLIGVVGEIYVRNHPFANNNIIKKLEALGAACSLAALAEWVYYTNFIRLAESKRKGRIKDCIVNLFTDLLEHKIEKALALPLEKRFGQLAEKDVKEILNYSSPYINDSLEGEAILSVGKIVEYFHEGVCGVVNVMPFGCMPSTIVGSITPRLSRDCKDMPILNLSFDGSEDAAFQTRIEAFYEQCCRRSNLTKEHRLAPSS